MDYRTVRAKVKRPTMRQRKAAALLASGKPVYHAMQEAGYTQATASQGWTVVPKTVLALMPQESNLVDLGRALNPELQENLVRGRLALNVLRGKDAGVNSAYRLGQDKRVNMFQPDTQVGVIIVQTPDSKNSDIPEE